MFFKNKSNEGKRKFSCMTRRFLWGERNGEEVAIEETYEKILFWKKNLFMLLTCAFSRGYIIWVTKLINEWLNDSSLKNIIFKVIHVIS